MTARDYALHSVCPNFPFFSVSPQSTIKAHPALMNPENLFLNRCYDLPQATADCVVVLSSGREVITVIIVRQICPLLSKARPQLCDRLMTRWLGKGLCRLRPYRE